MSLALLSALVVAAAVAALATPVVSRLALAIDAVDRPNDRKVNRRHEIPLLGGIAVALGFFVGLAVGVIVVSGAIGDDPGLENHLEAYLIGGALLLALGAVDDRYGLGALPKLGVQLLVAGVAIAFGFRIDHLTDPFSRAVMEFPWWFAWIATALWIVGVTNAVNLLDGLDGLATGVAAIIATTLAFIAWEAGHLAGAVVGVALVGSLLGFLPYNFPPGRIFLGDTGSLFIGYALALLSLDGYQKVTVLTFIVPILALAVPIMDTGLSVLRRIRRRQPIFSADRGHMHHRFLASEGSHRSAVLSLYFLTVCFCILAVSFTRLAGYAAILFLAAVLLLTFRLLRNLGFFELEEPAAEAPSSGDRDRS